MLLLVLGLLLQELAALGNSSCLDGQLVSLIDLVAGLLEVAGEILLK